MGFLIIFFVLFILFIILVVFGLTIVPQGKAYVVERLGKYYCTLQPGLNFKIPLIDNIVKKVSLKEQVLDFPPQSVITKDNVAMMIDSVVFAKIVDPKMFAYGAENPFVGVENLAATTLRNLVGSLDFDATLTSRELINSQMEQILDEATDPWGIKITRVEVKDIQPPEEIQEVMTKQMRAEREKRQAILESEAHKQAIVTRAEGDKQALVLQAEAQRDAAIAKAQGQAKSIELVYQAQAEGLRKLSEINVSKAAIELKRLEALKDVANGNATKIIVPSDIASSACSSMLNGELLKAGFEKAQIKQAEPEEVIVDECLHNESSPISAGAAKLTGYDLPQGIRAQAPIDYSKVGSRVPNKE